MSITHTIAPTSFRTRRIGATRRSARHCAMALAIAALVSGCGGGGGGGSSGAVNGAANGSDNSTGTTNGAGTSTPGVTASMSVDEKAMSQIAYTAKARLAIAANPSLLPQLAVFTQFVSAGVVGDAQALGQTFSSAQREWTGWYAKSAGNEFDAHVKMFSLLGTALSGQSAAAATAVLNGFSALLDQSSQDSPPDAWWRANRHVKADEVIDAFITNCRASAAGETACDAVFKSVIGVSVTAGYGAICATGDSGACNLPAIKSMSKAQVMQAVSDAVAATNAKSAACASGTPTCGDKPQARALDAQSIKNTISAIADGASHYNIIDDSLAKDIKAIGGAATDIYASAGKLFDAFQSLDPKSLKSLTQWSQWSNWIFGEGASDLSTLYNAVKGIVSSVNTMVAAVTTVIDLFTKHGAQSDPNVLQQIAALQKLVSQMRTEMHDRFDIVDTKLDKIFLTMVNGLASVDVKLNNVNNAIAQAQLALGNLKQQVSGLSLTMQAMLSDLSRQDLNNILGLASTVDETEFKKEETALFNYLINTTVDGLHAGPSNANWPSDVLGELLHATGFTINALATYPAMVLHQSAISGQRLANPSELVYAGRMYASLLKRYPQFVRKNTADVKSHITQIIANRIQPINALMVGIQTYPDLFANLTDNYVRAASHLQDTINSEASTFLQNRSGVGQNLAAFNLWSGAGQDTGYVPSVVRLGKIGPCSGAGSQLALPANWQQLFPSASARNAEALGLGNITTCYDLGSGAGGWTSYQEIKIKVDRYWAWGVLALTINSYFSGNLIASRTMVAPGGDQHATSSICLYFTTGDIRGAYGQMPASTALAQAWENSFHGNDWCNGAGFVPTNLRKAFDTDSVPSWDWATGAPTNKSAVDAAVLKSLTGLQNAFYSQVPTQIAGATDIGNAARSLAAAKLAIQRFLEIGMPGLVANNVPLQSLFFGSSPLPDDVSVASLYASTVSGGPGVTAKLSFVEDAKAKSADLKAIIDNAIGRVRRGETIEQLSELAAVQTELELLQATCAGTH